MGTSPRDSLEGPLDDGGAGVEELASDPCPDEGAVVITGGGVGGTGGAGGGVETTRGVSAAELSGAATDAGGARGGTGGGAGAAGFSASGSMSTCASDAELVACGILAATPPSISTTMSPMAGTDPAGARAGGGGGARGRSGAEAGPDVATFGGGGGRGTLTLTSTSASSISRSSVIDGERDRASLISAGAGVQPGSTGPEIPGAGSLRGRADGAGGGVEVPFAGAFGGGGGRGGVDAGRELGTLADEAGAVSIPGIVIVGARGAGGATALNEGELALVGRGGPADAAFGTAGGGGGVDSGRGACNGGFAAVAGMGDSLARAAEALAAASIEGCDEGAETCGGTGVAASATGGGGGGGIEGGRGVLIVTIRLINNDEGGPSLSTGLSTTTGAGATFGADGGLPALADGSVTRAGGGASTATLGASASSTFGGAGV